MGLALVMGLNEHKGVTIKAGKPAAVFHRLTVPQNFLFPFFASISLRHSLVTDTRLARDNPPQFVLVRVSRSDLNRPPLLDSLRSSIQFRRGFHLTRSHISEATGQPRAATGVRTVCSCAGKLFQCRNGTPYGTPYCVRSQPLPTCCLAMARRVRMIV